MPYPDRYDRTTDFARDQQLGIGIRGIAVNAELSRIAGVLNQANTFLRRFTTTDGRLKLDQAVRIRDVITEELFDGTGVQTVFTFAQPVDSTVDLVRVFVGGVRTDPVSYNDTTFTMAVAPIVGADNVQVLIYTNLSGVLNRLLSVVSDEGADLIGYDDPESRYDANTVGPALTEVMRDLDALILALGDLSLYLLTDGSRVLTGQWELNERSSVIVPAFAAVGSFRITGLPADGGLITISDGTNTPIIFEFDTNATVTPGNTPVTVGPDIATTAANFVTALNNAPLAVVASAVDGGAFFTLNLQNEIPYSAGNVAITFTATNTGTYVGMAGGVDGSFSAAYKNYYRIRNSPRSIRDGDVVVHEQLNDLITAVNAITSTFLRTDGSNSMSADLDMGGNKVVNLAAATVNGNAVRFDEFMAIVASQITSGVFDRARLPVFGGDAGAGGLIGAVPAPLAGDAAANKFLSADGTFKLVPSNLGGYIQLQFRVASGVAPALNTGGSVWTTLPVNTEVVDTQNACTLGPSGGILANQFELAAGTYRVDVLASLSRVDNCKLRVQDITNTALLVVGMTHRMDVGELESRQVPLRGRFTLASAATVEVQYAAQTVGLLGRDYAASGEDEIYADIVLVKE